MKKRAIYNYNTSANHADDYLMSDAVVSHYSDFNEVYGFCERPRVAKKFSSVDPTFLIDKIAGMETQIANLKNELADLKGEKLTTKQKRRHTQYPIIEQERNNYRREAESYKDKYEETLMKFKRSSSVEENNRLKGKVNRLIEEKINFKRRIRYLEERF